MLVTLKQVIKQEYMKNMKKNIYEKIEDSGKNSENRKKNEGVVYTPKYICDFIINKLNPNPEETVFEPSAGHGVFIFALLDFMKEKYKLSPSELLDYLNNKVYSFELSEKSCNEFQNIISDYFKNIGLEDAVYKNIYNEDTLLSLNIKDFDIGFGNPPYIRIKNIEEEYSKKIRECFVSCKKGNIDIYYAFIELALNNCKRVGMITPNSYLTNVSAQSLRNLMLDRAEYIIDFKDKMIFNNASTYTSIFILDNKSHNKLNYSNDMNKEWVEKDKEILKNRSWFFNEHEEFIDKVKIREPFTLNSGIATLKDKVYIVDTKNDKNIEEDVLVDFYKITKKVKSKIIFPYDENFNILDESLLSEKFPSCYSHLLDNQKDLLGRDKGKIEKYEAWYAYGRKQGFPKRIYKYNLMIPIMFSDKTKTFIIESENIILFSSGYMISSDDLDDINKIKEIIESEEYFKYISIYGKIWKGQVNSPYYTFGIKVLREYLNQKVTYE